MLCPARPLGRAMLCNMHCTSSAIGPVGYSALWVFKESEQKAAEGSASLNTPAPAVLHPIQHSSVAHVEHLTISKQLLLAAGAQKLLPVQHLAPATIVCIAVHMRISSAGTEGLICRSAAMGHLTLQGYVMSWIQGIMAIVLSSSWTTCEDIPMVGTETRDEQCQIWSMFFQSHLQLGRAPPPCEGVQDGHVGKEQVLVGVAAAKQCQVAPIWQCNRSVTGARHGVISLDLGCVLGPLPAVQLE